jgi:hypothetical protein
MKLLGIEAWLDQRHTQSCAFLEQNWAWMGWKPQWVVVSDRSWLRLDLPLAESDPGRMSRWCETECQGRWHKTVMRNWFFELERDAILFKLYFG